MATRTVCLLGLGVIGLVAGCVGSVTVTETSVNMALVAGMDRYLSSFSSTITEYPQGEPKVEDIPEDARAMIAAVRAPEGQAPASLRFDLRNDNAQTSLRLALPLPLHPSQEILVVRSPSPDLGYGIGAPADTVAFTLVTLGCPPDANVIVDGAATIDPTKCDPPVDGAVTGTIRITSTRPLEVQVDITLTPDAGPPTVIRGPLTFTITESRYSYSD